MTEMARLNRAAHPPRTPLDSHGRPAAGQRRRGPAVRTRPAWRGSTLSHTEVEPGLLRQAAHSPSYFALARGGDNESILDFCIPCNPYFPTPQMFGDLADNLETILKYYPSDAGTITPQLARVLGRHPQTWA